MLKSLEIQNFKGIKQGKLDDLAQVNILVGRNNSGKSTILDALILLRCGVVQIDRLEIHGLQQIVKRRVNSGNPNYSEFWFRLNTETPITLTAEFLNDKKIKEEWVSYGGQNLPGGQVTFGNMALEAADDQKILSINPSRNYSDKDYRRSREWSTLSESVGERNVHYLSQVQFLDTTIIHSPVNEDFWYELSKDRSDKKLIQMLNEIYQTDIEHMSFMLFPPPDRRLVAALPNTSVAVSWLGDGLRYASNILALGVFLKGTALLVEELETHQHPESLRKLIQTLFELAREQNLQLFLTTHSMELITYALDAAEERGIDLKLHHLILDPEGTLTSIPMSQPNAKVLLDIGHDPRLHYKYVNVE